MHTFNLSQFRKKAFYEGGKGLVSKQTRGMMNCYKSKLDSGVSAQEAWQSCLDEYNNKENWATKYAKSEK